MITRRTLFKLLAAAPSVAIPAPAIVKPTTLAPRLLDTVIRKSPTLSVEIVEDALRLLGVMAPYQTAARHDVEYCQRVGERLFYHWPETYAQTPWGKRQMIRALAVEIAPSYNIDRRPLMYELGIG